MPRSHPVKTDTVPNSIHPKRASTWRAWLARHHGRQAGVWLISYKKETGKPRMDYAEAVEEALCFGWVDSLPRALDVERAMLWFAPRKAGTNWSKANRERVERLIATGRMAPAGLVKVEAAKTDGSWSALEAVEAFAIDPDLGRAFAAHAGSRAHFEAFPSSVRKAILEWIQNAKRPETRARRIEETARLAAENRRANQWRDRKGGD